MPTFRALVERKIPSRTRRFARFLQDFLHPRISRTKSRNIFREFFNPSIERSGLAGKLNFFLNPEPNRTGFMGFINEFINPAVRRRGFAGIINQFLQPLPYRLEKPSSIFDEQDRRVGFMSRFLAAIAEFLNPRVNFAEYIGREITVIEPSEQFAEAIDDLVDRTRNRLANLAKRLDNETITPAQFRDNVISEIRKLHIEAAFLGIKGVGSITPNILELIDQRVSRELNFFQRFFVERVQDRFSDAQIAGARGDGAEVLRRLSQYASAGRVTGLATQQQLIEDLFGGEGQTLEMRVLGSCNNCFVAGTEVMTPNGPIEIQEIRKGDLVTTRFGDFAVLNTHKVVTNKKLYIVNTNGNEMILTEDHLLLTRSGWKEARNINKKDKLVSYENGVSSLNKQNTRLYPYSYLTNYTLVYDIEVCTVHEYTVNGNVVHNCPDCISLAGFWAPLGTLPAIGTETRCMGNCCCRKIFCTASRDGDCPDEPGIGT